MFAKLLSWFSNDGKKRALEKSEEDRFVSEGGPDAQEARMAAKREAAFVNKRNASVRDKARKRAA